MSFTDTCEFTFLKRSLSRLYIFFKLRRLSYFFNLLSKQIHVYIHAINEKKRRLIWIKTIHVILVITHNFLFCKMIKKEYHALSHNSKAVQQVNYLYKLDWRARLDSKSQQCRWCHWISVRDQSLGNILWNLSKIVYAKLTSTFKFKTLRKNLHNQLSIAI